MNERARVDWALGIFGVVIAAIFVGKLFAGESSILYGSILTPAVMRYAAALPKLAALLGGAVAAYACAQGFDEASPPRRAWSLMTLWLGTWLVAQSMLGYYQLILSDAAPFPSAADALFMVGYPAMIVAVLVFIRTYVATGMFGETRDHAAAAFIAAVPLCVAAVLILSPVLASGGEALELALNVAYPALDLFAMVPTIVLLRITLKLRGGSLFWVWTLICAGLVFMVIGDLLFGYFELLGLGFLEPLLDLCYIASYAFIARGVYQQYLIVRGS
ncbi:MAG: hypothetical protein JRH11_03620 [Deltaproteobacteria bacterium]|nr:hypothetical protein [Deltaproteobacteria bacterium]